MVDIHGEKKDFKLVQEADALLNRATLEAIKRFHCIGQAREVTLEAEMEWQLVGANRSCRFLIVDGRFEVYGMPFKPLIHEAAPVSS